MHRDEQNIINILCAVARNDWKSIFNRDVLFFSFIVSHFSTLFGEYNFIDNIRDYAKEWHAFISTARNCWK